MSFLNQEYEDFKAYNSKYQGIDVQVQDQYSEMVNYYMRNLIRQLTVVTAVINTYTIEVTDASLVTAGNSVCIQQGLRSFQAGILSKLGNVLTLDTPLDFTFTTDATLYECSFAMNVNGSVTPVSFVLNPAAGVKADIYGISIMMIDSTGMDDSKFGGSTALTKGIVLRKRNTIHRTYFNCKTNGELKLVLGSVNPYTDKAGGGKYGFNAYYDFKSNNGVSIRLDGDLDESLEMLIQNDLTGLDDMKVFVHGHFVE